MLNSQIQTKFKVSIYKNEGARAWDTICAATVWHFRATFVQIVLGLISQEPLATENTFKNINYRFIIEAAAQQIWSLFL